MKALLAASVMFAGAQLARADVVDDEPGRSDDDPDEDKQKQKDAVEAVATEKDKKTDKKEKPAIVVGGRVFALGEIVKTDLVDWTGELKLESARVGVAYRWKNKLTAKVSLEAAGNDASVRDAFLEIKAGDGGRIRAGRFKLPISSVEQASAWTLPTIGRPFLAKVLEDGVGLTGRREGVQAAWTQGPLRLVVAINQSITTTGSDPEQFLDEGGGIAAAVRVEVSLCTDLRIGVVGSNREVNYVSATGRYWAGGVDADLDFVDHGVPLRLWADAVVGTSHLAAASGGDASTPFVGGQLAAGWRLGGRKKGKRYVEPFVAGAFLNPNLERKRDNVSELQLGASGGTWRRWRAQVQLSVVTAQRYRPAGLAGTDEDIDDQIVGAVQLGASF